MYVTQNRHIFCSKNFIPVKQQIRIFLYELYTCCAQQIYIHCVNVILTNAQ